MKPFLIPSSGHTLRLVELLLSRSDEFRSQELLAQRAMGGHHTAYPTRIYNHR